MIYLDNAATTAPSDVCVHTVTKILTDCFANPSSLYNSGFESAMAISHARQSLAQIMGIKLSLQFPELVFTASGSEANNIAILGTARARRAWGTHIVCTAYEHPAVLNVCRALEREGFELSLILPRNDGNVHEDDITNAIKKDTALCCAMHVNNETGAIIDVESLAAKIKQINPRTSVHIDGVQALCKLPLNLQTTQIDTYAVSGHKLHAPKGVGALYIRKGFNIIPSLYGGGQERNLRPGTENIAYIVAFAACAAEEALRLSASQMHIATLANKLWQGLDNLGCATRNSPSNGYCGIANFSVLDVKSQPLLNALDARGICVSSGSACSKGIQSHTLLAMGLPPERIDSAIRVSFCATNTEGDVAALLSALTDIIPQIAKVNQRGNNR